MYQVVRDGDEPVIREGVKYLESLGVSRELIKGLSIHGDIGEPAIIDVSIFVRAKESPLGITDEHRNRGEEEAERDYLRQISRQLMEGVHANLKALDELPDGAIVRCYLPGCEGHPVEMLR